MSRPLALALVVLSFSAEGLRAQGWTQVSAGLPKVGIGAGALVVDPAHPSTIFAVTQNGVFKTTDGAGSWTPISAITAVVSLAINPSNSSVIYAATNNGLFKSTDGGASWRGANTGLAQGYVASVAIDPEAPSTLYAVSGGLYKSADAGANWAQIASPDACLAGLVISPKISSTLYAYSCIAGVFVSTDAGASWRSLNAGLPLKGGPPIPNWSIQAARLAIDPATPSTIYLSYIEFMNDPGTSHLLKSADSGASWTDLDPGLSFFLARAFAINPANPSTVYVLYGDYVHDTSGILKSTDGGESWNAVGTGLAAETLITSLVMDPASPEKLYAGYTESNRSGGAMRTADGGSTWQTANDGLSVTDIRTLVADPNNSSAVYAAVGTEGLFKSADQGASWSKLSAIEIPAAAAPNFTCTKPCPFDTGPAAILSLVVDPSNPQMLYAATGRANGSCIYLDNLIFKSADGGSTWSNTSGQPSSGCAPASVLALDPGHSNIVYVGGSNWDDAPQGWVSQTSDGGATWSKESFFNGELTALTIDYGNPATLYAGSTQSLFKSMDGGISWADLGGFGIGVSVITIDPVNPKVIYVAARRYEETGFYPLLSGFGGILKSADGGASWTAINDGLGGLLDLRSPVTAIVADPAAPNNLYLGASGYGVFRSTDGGAHWSAFSGGLTNFDVRTLALAGMGAKSMLYAGTNAGVYAIPVGN